MKVETTRFGSLEVDTDNILLFPDGIVGFNEHRHWVLLGEGDSDSIGWLQSLTGGDVAVPVVSPHRFVPNYALRMYRSELFTLPWDADDDAIVLAIVAKNDGRLTLNLKAPLLVNLSRCIGRQVIASDEQPMQFALPEQTASLRKSA